MSRRRRRSFSAEFRAEAVALVRKSGKSFKVVLNRAVREGLAKPGDSGAAKPFRVKARRMGLRGGIDPGALNRLLDEVEVDGFLDEQARRR